jgi:hypothetical protein
MAEAATRNQPECGIHCSIQRHSFPPSVVFQSMPLPSPLPFLPVTWSALVAQRARRTSWSTGRGISRSTTCPRSRSARSKRIRRWRRPIRWNTVRTRAAWSSSGRSANCPREVGHETRRPRNEWYRGGVVLCAAVRHLIDVRPSIEVRRVARIDVLPFNDVPYCDRLL